MKKLLALCFTVSSMAFALSIPGVCDVGDAKEDRFEKKVEYEIMKECMSGSFSSYNAGGYNQKLDYCSCLVGALSCYFKTSEELNKADEKKMEKAMKLTQKCYDKSN